MIDAIVAVYSDWGIGENGTQPVVVRADRRHFRSVTGSAAVIVGRKTLADFPGGRPLPGRTNIVLTHGGKAPEGALCAGSVEQALSLAAGFEQTFVIGGESVYRALLPHVGRVYVTKIESDPHSDAFFPNLDADEDWRVSDPGTELEENGLRYRFMVYERI